MKRMLLTLTLLLFCLGLVAIEIGMVYDISTDHQLVGRSDEYKFNGFKSEAGFSPYLETFFVHTDFYKGGLGVEYQIPRAIKDPYEEVGTGWFSFAPFYLANRIYLPTSEIKTKFIIEGDIGYNSFRADPEYLGNTDVKGGLYLAGGVGFEFPRVTLRAMYKENRGSIKGNEYIKSVVNKMACISVGLRLDDK